MKKSIKWLWGALLLILLIVGGWYGYQRFIRSSISQQQQVKRVASRKAGSSW